MPQFTYTAVDTSGKRTSGNLEAVNKKPADRRPQGKGLYLIEATDRIDTAARDVSNVSKKSS